MKREVKEDHINIKVKDQVRARGEARRWDGDGEIGAGVDLRRARRARAVDATAMGGLTTRDDGW